MLSEIIAIQKSAEVNIVRCYAYKFKNRQELIYAEKIRTAVNLGNDSSDKSVFH